MPRRGGGTTRAPTHTAPVLAVRMRLAEPTVPMLVTREGCERATSPAQPRAPWKWSAGYMGLSDTPQSQDLNGHDDAARRDPRGDHRLEFRTDARRPLI